MSGSPKPSKMGLYGREFTLPEEIPPVQCVNANHCGGEGWSQEQCVTLPFSLGPYLLLQLQPNTQQLLLKQSVCGVGRELKCFVG